jgi:putative copper resistance protein D
VEDWLHPLLRALHYALLLGLFGATAFPPIGLRDVSRTFAGPLLTAAAFGAPAVSLALMLVSVAAMMGQPLADLAWPTVEAIAGGTDIGRAFLMRLGLLLAAALLVRKHPASAAVLYGLALVTLPWSGHAAVGEGTLGLAHRINDAAHLLAAGLWLGAIGWFAALAFCPSHTDESAHALLVAMRRFAPLGVLLVGLVTLTGLANGLFIVGLPTGTELFTIAYGQVLAAKLCLVGLMLLCAARHAALARRDLSSEPDGRGYTATLITVRRSLGGELLFAAGVIAAVAWLGLLSPSAS